MKQSDSNKMSSAVPAYESETRRAPSPVRLSDQPSTETRISTQKRA